MARRRQLSRSSPRRRVGWNEGPGGFNEIPITVTTSSVSILGLGQTLLADGFTLVRTRGLIQLALTANTAAGDGFQGAFGICVVFAESFGVGVTAIPDPVTDMNWDGWLWHSFFSLIQGSVFSAQVSAGSGNKTLEIDSKAMRKLRASDTIVLVGEFIETGTAVMIVSGTTRILLKLP